MLTIVFALLAGVFAATTIIYRGKYLEWKRIGSSDDHAIVNWIASPRHVGFSGNSGNWKLKRNEVVLQEFTNFRAAMRAGMVLERAMTAGPDQDLWLLDM